MHESLKKKHKSKKKQNNLVLFAIPQYCLELNKIENTFKYIKMIISFFNLNRKDFKKLIVEEIRKL